MKSIAGYKIDHLLAKGGMAAIYLAEQESLQRHVVLKFLNPKLSDQIRKRFIDEGRIIASLKHPHIITVFDVVSDGKNDFLAMEYLDGGDLEQRLKQGIDTYEALDILNKIADAMHLVHKQGIIHGDIKPANVLFRKNGCPLLTDFGISRKLEPKKSVDIGTDDLYASPIYASPELLQGKPFDYRTDIYSLGIMMYEMLAGEKPYQGENELDIIAKSIQAPIPKLPKNLAELQPLLESLLAKTPEQRISDTKLVSRFISQYLKDHPELKPAKIESKLIDSNVIVEYITKKKTQIKRSHILKGPIPLAFILAVVLLWNMETWWNTWFGIESSDKESTVSPSDLQQQAEQKQKIRQERISKLLSKGNASLKGYRLTTPLNDNALYYFQKVLEMDSSNEKAQEGIDQVVHQYEVLARNEIDKYSYEKAQHYIGIGLSIDSDNQSLLELQKEANILNEPKRAIKKVKKFFNDL